MTSVSLAAHICFENGEELGFLHLFAHLYIHNQSSSICKGGSPKT